MEIQGLKQYIMEDYKSEYEAALARAKAVYLTDDDKKGAMETVFPELMELDKDDEIRQALIKYFALWGKSTPSTMGIRNEDIVDWLKRVKSVRVKSAKVTGKLAEMFAERNFEVKVHYWTEEDEKVRKQLLDFVHRHALASYSDRDKWVAWLEKQGKVEIEKPIA